VIVRKDLGKILFPSTVFNQLYDGLVAFALDEQFALPLSEVISAGLLGIVHVKQDFGALLLYHLYDQVEGCHC